MRPAIDINIVSSIVIIIRILPCHGHNDLLRLEEVRQDGRLTVL
jgi:hypothetical protein